MSIKNSVLLTACLFLTFSAAAQDSKSDLLVRHVWKIQSDEMSGLGVHTSLEKDTELTFLSDGTWKSSQPIKEMTNGNWKLENNERNLVMKFGK